MNIGWKLENQRLNKKGVNMNLSELEESIKNNNIDKALKIIADIGVKKYKEACPILMKYFEITNNNILRNEIAIALSDIGYSEAVEPIINMIRNPKTIGSRGTLLYSLESFDYSSYIELLVDLLYDDNFEVSRQAFILIENIIKNLSDETKQKCINNIQDEIDKLEDKVHFLIESKKIFL